MAAQIEFGSKAGSRSSSRALTLGLKGMLPNVVIAGAPKCGTTSLFAWLADHPDVCGSNVKEARYFLDPDDPLFDEISNFRDHGLAGYEAYFTDCEERKAQVVLEATPVYLYQQTAPEGLVADRAEAADRVRVPQALRASLLALPLPAGQPRPHRQPTAVR